jgi:hypothetical protein
LFEKQKSLGLTFVVNEDAAKSMPNCSSKLALTLDHPQKNNVNLLQLGKNAHVGTALQEHP